MESRKIAIVVGTRPEIIKMAPIIKECQKRNLNFKVIHSGQHYSHSMDRVFFEDLHLGMPEVNLHTGSGSHCEETAQILLSLERYLLKEQPDVVLVEGDTNTVLAAALCSSQLRIRVGHVEAGLRSFDRSMPEEKNRILVDHLSEFLFAPTEISKRNLLNEGIDEGKIYVTGNTIVDVLHENIGRINSSHILKRQNLKRGEFALLTLHRDGNVDNEEMFNQILKGVELIFKEFGLLVVYPMHPRARKNFEKFGFCAGKGLRLIEPVGYIDFLSLQQEARLVLTDSGGVQEEACILQVPCVTIRPNTERPETLEVKSNVIAGLEAESIINCANIMLRRKREWANPFGDGKASSEILSVIMSSWSA